MTLCLNARNSLSFQIFNFFGCNFFFILFIYYFRIYFRIYFIYLFFRIVL